MGYQWLPNLLTSLSIYIEREKKRKRVRILYWEMSNKNKNNKNKNKNKNSVVGSMRKKMGRLVKFIFCIHDELVFSLIILYKINVMKATIRRKKNIKI